MPRASVDGRSSLNSKAPVSVQGVSPMVVSGYVGKALVKRKVFSLDLKVSRDSAERTETGREFQSFGPEKEKARLPREVCT